MEQKVIFKKKDIGVLKLQEICFLNLIRTEQLRQFAQ